MANKKPVNSRTSSPINSRTSSPINSRTSSPINSRTSSPIKKSAGNAIPIVAKQSDTTTVVAAVNGYTQEKVEYVVKFLSDKKQKSNQDWVDVYNYVKGTNVKIDAVKCRACTMAKYTTAVRNYAKYGEITLRVNNKWVEKKEETENVTETAVEPTENVKEE